MPLCGQDFMEDFYKIGLLFALGVISSVINVNAGGGSSLTLPALIFLGLESAVANGTNRIGILVQNIFAISAFRREKFHEFRKSLILSLYTLPGAIAGALVSVRLSNEAFQRILGLVMIGIVISMLFSQRRAGARQTESKGQSWLIYPAMVGIGFFGGFIQVGVGFLLMASLYHLLRLGLVHVNMHKVFIIFIFTIPALIIFIVTGNIHWGYGIALAAGTALGAWWGAKLAVRGGEKVIRCILAVAIVIMALKLLGLY